jgi:hypothetical protein
LGNLVNDFIAILFFRLSSSSFWLSWATRNLSAMLLFDDFGGGFGASGSLVNSTVFVFLDEESPAAFAFGSFAKFLGEEFSSAAAAVDALGDETSPSAVASILGSFLRDT